VKQNKPTFSIIIPIRIENDYLKETLFHLSLQSYKSFEILVITDKISGSANPAQKRNHGAKIAKGKYLAFLDDDSYPSKDWLKNSFKYLNKHPNTAAVCGPCLTPPQNNIYQKSSGLLWASHLGSGGAGTYRNSISPPRYVQDFPSVNLIVKKKYFDLINGFDTYHWPGEDTILCLNLINLGKKIYYHPSIQVFHHRRAILMSHLQQIRRYALHRGNFARIFPKTSLKIGYFGPSLSILYTTLLFLLFFTKKFTFTYGYISIILLFPFILYIFLLLITFVIFLKNKNSFFLSLLTIITIPVTHVYYGILFIYGFFKKKLDFTPHSVNSKTGDYLGG